MSSESQDIWVQKSVLCDFTKTIEVNISQKNKFSANSKL